MNEFKDFLMELHFEIPNSLTEDASNSVYDCLEKLKSIKKAKDIYIELEIAYDLIQKIREKSNTVSDKISDKLEKINRDEMRELCFGREL